MGVPQGSVLSVTLLALKIKSIVKAIFPGVECSLYVDDDFLIVYRSKYIHIIERHVQRSLNMLWYWADTNDFKFSSSKTVCMHFCRLRSPHPNLELTLSGTLIPVVDQTKFLGVIFVNKLTFLPHIRYLKEKCVKALNLLRVAAHTSWGADQHTLLHLYRSLVRSKLDYGSVVYGSARESYSRILDPITEPRTAAIPRCLQNLTCLKYVCSSQWTSTLHTAKYADYTVFPQTWLFPEQSSLQYGLQRKIQSFLFSKPNQIPTLCIRIALELEKIGSEYCISVIYFSHSSVAAKAPWNRP